MAETLALRQHRVDIMTARPQTPGPTALLLRPDCYVAWACASPQPEPTEMEELRAALQRWFGVVEPARATP
ncbi:hypothetical protein [Actinomadura coerulea]|uniref:aromatic-ring hydroxylase C-terminal domain-containing protein n=1 Tax=Actinomadura coerulea TaxID=46159 RepID=UPI0030B8365D